MDPSDGIRIPKGIRNAIEVLDSDEVRRGFVNEVHNSRGVYSKALNEGGEQERKMAAEWTKTARSLKDWPKTASIARAVSDMWTAYANSEDQRRDKRRARGDR